MELSALSLRLRALSVLRGLLSHPLVRAYGDTLTALDGTAADFADRYGALCATRFSCGDIAQAVLDAVHFDTNTLTDTINAPEAAVLNAATHDLDALNALLALDGEAFKSAAADKFYEPALEDLPDFEAADSLPFSTGAALADYYREEGYGFFAQSSAFAMQDDGSATPIVHPDAIRLHDLPGYEMQKQKILKNTLAFLDGRDANNILLYGDKGTGKSSTVKAVANVSAAYHQLPQAVRADPASAVPLHRVPRRPDLQQRGRQLCRAQGVYRGRSGRKAVQSGHLRNLQPPSSHPREHG